MLFTSPDIETMVVWIEEGRLHPDDSVSRTGFRLSNRTQLAAHR
jgi:hypothetical protein